MLAGIIFIIFSGFCRAQAVRRTRRAGIGSRIGTPRGIVDCLVSCGAPVWPRLSSDFFLLALRCRTAHQSGRSPPWGRADVLPTGEVAQWPLASSLSPSLPRRPRAPRASADLAPTGIWRESLRLALCMSLFSGSGTAAPRSVQPVGPRTHLPFLAVVLRGDLPFHALPGAVAAPFPSPLGVGSGPGARYL